MAVEGRVIMQDSLNDHVALVRRITRWSVGVLRQKNVRRSPSLVTA